MLSARKDAEPLLVNGSSDINGSVHNDAVVRRNSFLHVHGNLKGSLTIEEGAKVVVEGCVGGKVINRGGRLVVNNKGIADFLAAEGPPEAEAGGVLKIDLSAVVLNWRQLARRSASECAAVVRADAFGCGVAQVAAALASSGCRTFFVSDLEEARRVRATAPSATIFVLNGLFPGTGPTFAQVNARPVINSLVEMAEWDVFVATSRWSGGFAVNVDTGARRLGLSADEAAALAARSRSPDHRITLLMSHLDNAQKSEDPLNDHQITLFQELRRLYGGVPASLAGSSGIFLGTRAHFDLVRAGAALYGINPTPGAANPMLPVVELHARIIQLRNLAAGESVADIAGWTAKRPTRVAVVSIGYGDGYPQQANSAGSLRAIVGGQRCPLVGRAAMDLLAIDLGDLADPTAVRQGDMVTLIGGKIGVDDLAAAAETTGRALLCNLGRRFHRAYYS